MSRGAPVKTSRQGCCGGISFRTSRTRSPRGTTRPRSDGNGSWTRHPSSRHFSSQPAIVSGRSSPSRTSPDFAGVDVDDRVFADGLSNSPVLLGLRSRLRLDHRRGIHGNRRPWTGNRRTSTGWRLPLCDRFSKISHIVFPTQFNTTSLFVGV